MCAVNTIRTMPTNEFVAKFDARNEKHVMWLKELYALARSNSPHIVNKMADNPLGAKASLEDRDFMLGWIEIHFALGMKYAQKVLEHKAWIPPESN
jgi:hypothetical protein